MFAYKIIAVSSLILTLSACGSDDEETNTTTSSTATSETGTTGTTTTETGLTETGLTETGTTTTSTTSTNTTTMTTTTTTTTTPPLTLADGVQDILTTSCTGYCHSGGSASANMDLGSGSSYANTVGVPSGQSTMNIVTAGDASSSYLVYKLANTHSEPPANGSGSSMPKGGDALSAADQALIVAWINDGANP